MPDHEGSGRVLLLGKLQELRRKLAHHVAVEADKVRNPKTVQHREQEQWIFRGFAKRFGLRDNEARLIEGRFRLARRKALGVHKGVGEGDLKLDLLAAPRRRARAMSQDWSRARLRCSTASTNAERSSSRCPALPHKAAALSISPASAQ